MEAGLKKAIKDSIKHWKKDILKPLLEGKEITEYLYHPRWKDSRRIVRCYGQHCPLCKYVKEDCKLCPIPQYQRKKTCSDIGSAWSNFIRDTDIKSAKRMIELLERCLK